MNLVQINLQQHFGGGEVFTAFLCRAMSALGVTTTLFVHPRAGYWKRLGLPTDTKVCLAEPQKLSAANLAIGPHWLLAHGPLPTPLLKPDPQLLRTAIAHMPVQGRSPRAYDGHDLVFAVSGWVRGGLIANDIPTWQNPLYGVADLSQRGAGQTLYRTSRYDWDQRKGRDRLFGLVEPLVESLRTHPVYERQHGLILGIVSRLTPIKQFPMMFRHLAPVLARHPEVRLEIFGAGGYASVRDLDAALRPCARQVRFWGQQRDVATAYRGIDYLLTGLPEKEALGLNVIEAQACGTPVIAVNAPPFTETVVEGQTGFFYRDPREDNGVDFERVLNHVLTQLRPDPRLAMEHLAKFSFDAFVERLRPIVAEVQSRLNAA